MRVETKTEEVERIKCDDCGVVDSRHRINVLALDPKVMSHKSTTYSNEWRERDWGQHTSWHTWTTGCKIEPEAYLDLCDGCLDSHLIDPEEHQKDSLERELERVDNERITEEEHETIEKEVDTYRCDKCGSYMGESVDCDIVVNPRLKFTKRSYTPALLSQRGSEETEMFRKMNVKGPKSLHGPDRVKTREDKKLDWCTDCTAETFYPHYVNGFKPLSSIVACVELLIDSITQMVKYPLP